MGNSNSAPTFTKAKDKLVLVESFQHRLHALGVSNEEFAENMRQSHNPRNTLIRYLRDFERLRDDGQQLGTKSRRPPPASKRFLSKLQNNIVTRTEQEAGIDNTKLCNICCEHFSVKDDNIKQLPCGHCFHAQCINAWLTRHCTCPVCRYEFPTDDLQYEEGRKERMKSRKVISSCYSDNQVLRSDRLGGSQTGVLDELESSISSWAELTLEHV